MLSTFFALLGLVWILSILLGLVKFIRLYFLAPSKLHRYVYRSTVSDGVLQTPKEPWAVVTGASDGIGRFLAAELAAAGLNVVLHGRSAAKLEKVQASLQSTYPARSFRLLVADASLVRGAAHFADDFNNKEDDDGTQVDFANMYNNVLRDLHITVLINNVGGGIKNPLMGDFLAYTARQNAEAASKESLFALHLTHTLLPQLRRNGPGDALVVGVGSMADAGMPLAAVYSASKAFNKTLLACLALEERLDRRGGGRNGNNHRKKDGGGSSSSRGEVEIMHVRLGDVTDVTWRRGASSLLMPDARTAARAILARVGCGRSVVTAYWGHELLGVGLELLPIWLRERFLLSMMSGYRKSMEHKGGDASASIIGSGFF